MRTILILITLLSPYLQAHTVEQLFADFSHTNSTWELKIRFDAGLSFPEMRQDKDTTQPKREWLTSLSTQQLARIKSETKSYLQQYLKPNWKLHHGEQTILLDCIYTFPAWKTDPPTFDRQVYDTGFAYFDVVISGNLTNLKPGELNLHIPKENHPDLAIQFKNKTILTLYPGQSLTLLDIKQTLPTKPHSFLNFLEYGYQHVIPKGWDHVLFIIALVCLTFSWKPLLTQSLTFTIGHTITLALVVTGTITTPSPNFMKWVEITIAATIIYIAIENVISRKVRAHRLIMIFIFGLIHGLGFASVLGDKIRSTDNLILPLISANFGIELGQITIIAITLFALLWAKNKSYFPTVITTISIAITLTAGYWVIERIIN